MISSTLPRIVGGPSLPKPAVQSNAPRATVLERLAAWAERQPQHHRLGNWTAAILVR